MPTVFHRVSPKCFSVQKDGTRGWVAHCCLLRCEGCCWIGLKPRFTLGPCQGTLRTQLCMCTLLPFHIWMLLKLVSGSHVWISPSIVVTCSLAGFAGSMCSCCYQRRVFSPSVLSFQFGDCDAGSTRLEPSNMYSNNPFLLEAINSCAVWSVIPKRATNELWTLATKCNYYARLPN